MKMHEFKQLGADPRCEHCGLNEQEGNHSIEVGGGTPGVYPPVVFPGPSYLLMTGSKDAMPLDEKERRFMKVDMAREENAMPLIQPKPFMEMKLDRACIGMRLLDTGDDAKAQTHLVYPGIPITRSVDLDQGNTHYYKTRCLYEDDLISYLGENGVDASWYD